MTTSVLFVDQIGGGGDTQYVSPTAPLPVAQVPTAAFAPSNATTTAYQSSLVIKPSAGILMGVSGYNAKTSAQFIQLHDSSTVPSDSAVPTGAPISVPASSNFSIDFGAAGRKFSTGIVVCNSSTGPTKTIGASDCFFDAQYT